MGMVGKNLHLTLCVLHGGWCSLTHGAIPLTTPTLRGCLSAPLCFFWCWHLSVEPVWHKLHGGCWQTLSAAASPRNSPELSASCPTSLLMEGPTACNVLCAALQEDGCFTRTAGAVLMEWLSHRCDSAGQDITGMSWASRGSRESKANSSRALGNGWQKEMLLRYPNQIN